MWKEILYFWSPFAARFQRAVVERFLRLTSPRGRCAARVQRVQRVVVSLLDSAFGARVQRVQKVHKVQRSVVSPLRGDEYICRL